MKSVLKQAALPLAVGVLSVASLPALADGPKFYGNLNVSVDAVDAEGAKTGGPSFPRTADHMKVSSHNSRLGVTHEIGLDHGLTAVLKAEIKLNADSDKDETNAKSKDKALFEHREIYAGVKGGFGQVIAGRINRPARTVEGRIDQFNHLYGDINTVMGGESFINNVVQYSTPKLGNVSAKVAFIAAEKNENKAGAEDVQDDGYSASVTFDNGSFYAALGYEVSVPNVGVTNIEVATTADDALVSADRIRLGLAYNFGKATLGTLVQQQENSNDSKKKDFAYVVSGSYTIDRVKLKAQYGSVEGDSSKQTRDYVAVGADYSLGKGSYVYTTFTQINKDEVTVEKTDNVFQIGYNLPF